MPTEQGDISPFVTTKLQGSLIKNVPIHNVRVFTKQIHADQQELWIRADWISIIDNHNQFLYEASHVSHDNSNHKH